MKDNLFTMLLDLFEKALVDIKEKNSALDHVETVDLEPRNTELDLLKSSSSSMVIKPASGQSMRIYTEDETVKLTKTSYQFLVRLSSWGVVSQELLELILHQLNLSKEPVITLDELKWSIRKALEHILDANQLAYLDLVLYHKEDGLLPN